MKFNISALFTVILIFGSCNSNNSSNNYSTHVNGDLDSSFIEKNTLPQMTPEQKFQREKDSLIAEGWKEQYVQNGELPSCYNFTPKKGNIDNYLEVYVGSGTDVAIKIMDLKTEKCIRYVYINSGSTYSIRNIPEGKYYLKIAYGKNWLSKVENGQCVGKFIINPMYEKGEDILDFNVEYNANGYSIPSYQLKLDVIATNILNSFNSHSISENEFNQ